MKANTATLRRLGALLAASTLAGCASGGGGGHSHDDDLGQLICILAFPLCLPDDTQQAAARSSSGSTSGVGTSASSPAFASWTELKPGDSARANALGVAVGYSHNQDLALTPFPIGAQYWENQSESVRRDSAGTVGMIGRTTYGSPQHTLEASGQPAIRVAAESNPNESQSAFTSVAASHVSAAADAYELGWNYQTFGVWTNGAYAEAASAGSVSPASAIPASGSATFNGKLAGLYVSPAGVGSVAAADVRVDADFSARSLSLASIGTTTTRDFAAATATPDLNLSGTLTYAPGNNAFAGTITSASGMSGTSKGRFYGPGAQELGGVFAVRSAGTAESFTGAYGAKR